MGILEVLSNSNYRVTEGHALFLVVKGGDFVHQKNQDVCDGLVGWEFLM